MGVYRFRWVFAMVGLLGKSPQQGPLHVDPQRLQQLLTELSQFGKNPEGGVTRLCFSEADRASRKWITEKMRQAGLDVWVDPAGNIHGRRGGGDSTLPVILFGSHTDSVPSGGNFDGNLGSMSALEVMFTLRDGQTKTRHPLEMVIWSCEDSGPGLFGSRAVTGRLEPGELERVDDEGVPFSERMRRFGLDPDEIDAARIDPKAFSAFLELHIEQGPILFRSGTDIGVVQGIVGIDEYDVTIEGFANHAGTTPMEERRDAMLAGARLVQAVRDEVMAKPGRQVGNVGTIEVIPGAPNVVPGLVKMNIELRDLERAVIEDMIRRIRDRAEAIAREERVSIVIERYSSAAPAPTNAEIQDIMAKAATEAGFSSLKMPSGAGHDAQILANVGVPIGMIFVPSRNGISHSPEEWTDWEDCTRGAEVLYRTVLELDRR